MARCHMLVVLTDLAGNVIQNAHVDVYLSGTATPPTDMYANAAGGAPITTLTTSARGVAEAYFDNPKRVDVHFTDNSDTAYYPPTSSNLANFSSFTRSVDVYLTPEDTAVNVVSANAAATGTFAIDCSATGVFKWTLIGNVVLSAINGAASQRVTSIVFFLTQGGAGNFGVTWPGNVKWSARSVPVLTAAVGGIDKIVLDTVDGGTTWLGALAGVDYG